jgi:ABC-type transport system involved in multi-copper enzyme maturation permease subunit
MSGYKFSKREGKLVFHFLWMSFLTLVSGAALIGIFFNDFGPSTFGWRFGMLSAFILTSFVSVFLLFQLKGDPVESADADC